MGDVPVTVVRPGLMVGHSQTGAIATDTNTAIKFDGNDMAAERPNASVSVYVAGDSTSNYLKTAPSIQSARNLEYLDGPALRRRDRRRSHGSRACDHEVLSGPNGAECHRPGAANHPGDAGARFFAPGLGPVKSTLTSPRLAPLRTACS